jgi:hypothetical protein
LWTLVWSGAIARALAAVLHLDQIWPDEHYQTLEPAATLLWDFGWRAWEWSEGVRSWAVPGLYLPVLALCKLFGADGGPACIIACRLATAAASTLFLVAFARVSCRVLEERLVRIVAVAAASLAPAMIAFGAATLSEPWALIALWVATALHVAPSRDGAKGASPRRTIVVGALFGLAFVFRVQTLAWTAAFVVCLAVRRDDRRVLLPLVLGFALVACAHGLLDWVTWGSPFHSTIAYARVHLFEGVSNAQGTMPAWAYLSLLWVNLGPVPTLAVVSLPFAALVLRVLRLSRERILVVVPAAIYVLAHVLVPHKEARFLLPAYPAILLFAAMALSDLWTKYVPPLEAASPTRATSSLPRFALSALCAALLAAISFGVLRSPAHYEPSDASDAARFVREDGGLQRHPGACWLFVDHYWVWARGELMQGHRVRFREVTAAALRDERTKVEAQSCVYALVVGERARLAAAELGAAWRPVYRSRYGHLLLRNDQIAPPTAREVPVSSVPSEVLVRLYEEALARDPGNDAVRRRFAELCRARGLPCALREYRELLRAHPDDAELRRTVDALERGTR